MAWPGLRDRVCKQDMIATTIIQAPHHDIPSDEQGNVGRGDNTKQGQLLHWMRLPGGERTCMMESACAKRERWQSPKSRPQILRFLSAAPLMSRLESEEMSMLSTGSLCPYSDKKNFRLSRKCTCTLQHARPQRLLLWK